MSLCRFHFLSASLVFLFLPHFLFPVFYFRSAESTGDNDDDTSFIKVFQTRESLRQVRTKVAATVYMESEERKINK